MKKRAAIYIRVSTELQSEQASTKAQENDCIQYAISNGYEVVGIYRDIERYRIGRRLVEPSGLRADRPSLIQMVADAEMGKFDIVIAWREDRLYRGYAPMLLVLNMVESDHATIDLVKGQFDPHVIGIKANVAKMEVDAFRERTHLGMKARLRAGKCWGGYKRYGYAREGDSVIVNDEEAKWVRSIFQWYLSGVGVREIARKLIAAGAKTKLSKSSKYKWQLSTIYRILHCEMYATGIHKVMRDGEVFELPVPQIIDFELYQNAQELLNSNHGDKGRNVKYKYLLRGMLTCPCGTSWNSYSRKDKSHRIKKNSSERKTYPREYGIYRCSRSTASVEKITDPDCPRTKGVLRLDRFVWEKVSGILSQPELLFEAAQAKLTDLKAQHSNASNLSIALKKKLVETQQKRQTYIQKFGEDSVKGGPFTQEDLDIALVLLAEEELNIRNELAELAFLVDTRITELESFVEEYLSDVRAGLEWHDCEASNEEEVDLQFDERRRIIKTLIEKVVLRRTRNPEIVFRLDLSPLMKFNSKTC